MHTRQAGQPQAAREDFAQAEQLFFKRQLVQAGQLCQQIVNSDRQFAPAWHLLAAISQQLGQFAQALECAQRALALQPENAMFHVQAGQALMSLGRGEEALQHLEKSYQKDPNSPIACLLIADLHARAGAFEKAQLFFSRAAKIKDMPELYEHRGLAWQMQGELDKAEKDFDIFIARRPDYFQAYVCKGKLLVAKRQPKAAEACFAKAVQLNPKSHEARLCLANALHMQEKDGQALAHAQQAANLKPRDIQSLLLLAELLLVTGKIQDAEKTYANVLALESENIVALHRLSDLLRQLGRREEALTLIDRLLALRPDDISFRYMRSAVLGEQIETAPRHYVEKLFDCYAQKFDHHLQSTLGYDTPAKTALLFKRHAQQGELSLLDLGCGTGLSGQALKPYCRRIVGVDLSEKMLEKARAKGVYDSLHAGDIVEFMRQCSERFDAAACLDVLVYIGNLEPVFEGVARRLKPGGLFAFSVEEGDDAPPYTLRPTARYAHARSYIESLAVKTGYAMVAVEKTGIRKDGLEKVQGYIFILRKNNDTSAA